MELTVLNDTEDDIDLGDFCEWLMTIVQNSLTKKINPEKLIKFNKYFERVGKTDLAAENIIVEVIENLVIQKTSPTTWVIKIHPNLDIAGENLYSMAKLINFGNESIQGIHIFTEEFEETAKNMEELWAFYRKI